MAARGTVHEPLLERLLAEPYYALPAPKTTGKELFHGPYLRAALAAAGPVPDDDVVATVTELTARTVADAVRSVHATEVIASGGGTRNPTLMGALRRALGTIALRTSDDLGLPAPHEGGVRLRRARLSDRPWAGRYGTELHRRPPCQRARVDHPGEPRPRPPRTGPTSAHPAGDLPPLSGPAARDR